MKNRVILFLLVIIIIFTGVNPILYAEEITANLVIDSVRCDNTAQEVTISGKLNDGSKYNDILIEVVEAGADRSTIDGYLASVENMGQIYTDFYGKFEYTFPVGRLDTKNFDIYVTAPSCGETVSASLKLYDTGSDARLLENSVILQADNRICIQNGQSEYVDNAPYMNENELMIAVSTIENVFGISVSNYNDNFVENDGVNYISATVLENFDLNINMLQSGDIAVITELTGDYNYEKMSEALGIYMSEDGNDDNDGTFRAPVKTIEKAIELAVARDYEIARCVYIREGKYRVEKTVEINSLENICISSYCGEEVIVSGGVQLSKEDFTLLTDSEKLKRVKQKAKGKIYTLDLSKYLSYISDDIRIYEQGISAVNGRWPDKEYTVSAADGYNLEIDYADKQMWKNEPNPKLYGYFSSTYQTGEAVLSVNDDMTMTSSVRASGSNLHHYTYNMLCETDIPGEWYIENGILYYYPMYNLDNVVVTAMRNELFEITDSKNITIDGITLENSRTDAVLISGSESVMLINSTIRQTVGRGVYITNSFNTTVENCRIYDIGKTAVEIECGDYVALTSGNTLIKNCRIYNFAALMNVQDAGVRVKGGMGTTVEGCIIHDSVAQGIVVTVGSEHTITKNEIYNVANYMADAGAVYINAGFIFRGNKITDNYIHDIRCNYSRTSDHVYAIYLDDFTSGAEVRGNTIANTNRPGKIGGGRDNIIMNNIIIGTDDGINYDDRGVMGKYGFHPSAMEGSTGGYENGSGGIYGAYFRLLGSAGYDQIAWYAKYPGFEQFGQDIEKEKAYYESGNEADYFDAALPVNSIMENNLLIYPSTLNSHTISFWWNPVTQYNTTYRNNLTVVEKSNGHTDKINSDGYNKAVITSDAKNWFEGYEDDNYQLKQDSAVFNILEGFEINSVAQSGTELSSIGAGKPYLVSPANGASCKSVVEFMWNKTGEADYFMLELSENEDMSNPLYTEITYKCLAELTLDAGTYYWRVTALDKSINGLTDEQGDVYMINVVDDYVDVKEYGLKQNSEIIKTPENGKVTAYISSDFVRLKNDSATVVFAERSSDGKVISVKTVDITEDNKDTDIEYSFDYECGDIIEIYIWNSVGAMYPYTNKIVIN